MKNLLYTLVALVMGFVIITGCSKNNDAFNKEKLNGKNLLNTKSDTVVTPPPADTSVNVPLTGDKIVLSPESIGGSSIDSVRLGFSISTTNLYCSNGIFKFNNAIDANQNFHIDLLHIQEPTVCRGTTDHPIYSHMYFNRAYLANGSYPLVITMNGITYTGNIIISATTITFDWNYTTGVVITPKTITRNY